MFECRFDLWSGACGFVVGRRRRGDRTNFLSTFCRQYLSWNKTIDWQTQKQSKQVWAEQQNNKRKTNKQEEKNTQIESEKKPPDKVKK